MTKLASPARRRIPYLVLAFAWALAMVLATGLPAQILHGTPPLPTFEVATIRPWKSVPPPPPPPSDAPIARPRPAKISPGATPLQTTDRLRFIGQIEILIASAFDLPVAFESQIVGAPDWARSEAERYDIQAKIEETQFAAMQKMTALQQREQIALLEQSLLADRFHLKVHTEMRDLQVYALVVAKVGPKLTPSTEGEKPKLTAQGEQLTAQAITLDQLARSPLLGVSGHVVVNQTGLTGLYDFTLIRNAERLSAGAESTAPSLFTAIQDQLGLKLVPTKAPVEVLVVDHIERPTVD